MASHLRRRTQYSAYAALVLSFMGLVIRLPLALQILKTNTWYMGFNRSWYTSLQTEAMLFDQTAVVDNPVKLLDNDKHVRCDEFHSGSCYGLGVYYGRLGDYQTSIEFFSLCSAARRVLSRFWIGWCIYQEQGERQAAQYWAQDPNWAVSYGLYLLRGADYSELGIETLRMAMPASELPVRVFLAVGDAVFWKDWKVASMAYNRVLEVDPANTVAQLQYARGLFHFEGRALEAKEEIVELLPRLESDAQNKWVAHRVLGAICVALGQYEEAAVWYEQALNSKEIRDQVSSAALAHIYEKLGDVNRAIEYYGDAIAARPSDTAVIAGRARLLNALGRTDEATQDWHTILQIDPDDSEASAALQKAGPSE